MIILHHYPMSLFSEKMRLMFGYCGLQWQAGASLATWVSTEAHQRDKLDRTGRTALRFAATSPGPRCRRSGWR